MSTDPQSREAGAAEDAPTSGAARGLAVAIDAMGGDHGPDAALDGLESALAAERGPNDDAPKLLLFGDPQALTERLARRPRLAERAEIRACPGVIAMDAAPTEALRRGRDSSMWGALDAVARGEADAAVSSGNTAALMTLATVRLRTTPGVARPAIAALWPSNAPGGASVVLDMGADLRAGPELLADYALMGAVYARLALGRARPKIALLNVGSEPSKGPPELRVAAERIAALAAGPLDAQFVGFIEGDAIPSGRADVIVTDGFTGNIALKTAEGAARLVSSYVREAFEGSTLGRIAALLAAPALARAKRRMDPRRVNGGVFLGLAGAVVKSHGGSDAVGFAAAARLAERVARGGLARAIAAEVARLGREDVDAAAAAARLAAQGR